VQDAATDMHQVTYAVSPSSASTRTPAMGAEQLKAFLKRRKADKNSIHSAASVSVFSGKVHKEGHSPDPARCSCECACLHVSHPCTMTAWSSLYIPIHKLKQPSSLRSLTSLTSFNVGPVLLASTSLGALRLLTGAGTGLATQALLSEIMVVPVEELWTRFTWSCKQGKAERLLMYHVQVSGNARDSNRVTVAH